MGDGSGARPTVRAAVAVRYGSPDVIRIEDVPAPQPGEREILVAVHATTVNRTDAAYRRGHPFFARAFTGLRAPKATVAGTEFAGEVVEVGPGTERFAPGDRVFGYVEDRYGAHASSIAVAEDAMVAAIPEGTDMRHAAAATEGSHYALSALDVAEVGPGTRALVYGATGAIGSAAVQLMTSAGASVTAVCATPHVDLVRGLGADRVVDYTTADFTQDELRYDVVFDAVGKTSFPACRRLLTDRGVFLATDFGPFPTNPGWVLLTRLSRGRRVRFPLPRTGRTVIHRLRQEMEMGRFVPVLDEHRFTLEQIADAHRYVDSGQKVGNVVVDVV